MYYYALYLQLNLNGKSVFLSTATLLCVTRFAKENKVRPVGFFTIKLSICEKTIIDTVKDPMQTLEFYSYRVHEVPE